MWGQQCRLPTLSTHCPTKLVLCKSTLCVFRLQLGYCWAAATHPQPVKVPSHLHKHWNWILYAKERLGPTKRKSVLIVYLQYRRTETSKIPSTFFSCMSETTIGSWLNVLVSFFLLLSSLTYFLVLRHVGYFFNFFITDKKIGYTVLPWLELKISEPTLRHKQQTNDWSEGILIDGSCASSLQWHWFPAHTARGTGNYRY